VVGGESLVVGKRFNTDHLKPTIYHRPLTTFFVGSAPVDVKDFGNGSCPHKKTSGPVTSGSKIGG